MGFNICPAAVVSAPVESVWELLADPTLYDLWWAAGTPRIIPEGKAAPGQMLYVRASGYGMRREVPIKIEMVNPAKHQIQFTVTLPFGVVNHQTTTCAALDPKTCRLQFG